MTRTKRSRRLLRATRSSASRWRRSRPAAACQREQGIGRSLAEYDYVVLRPKDTHQYHAAATSILDQSFVALKRGIHGWIIPRVRRKACMVSIDYVRGFWSSSGWVDACSTTTRARS